jgi:hypothetical protein
VPVLKTKFNHESIIGMGTLKTIHTTEKEDGTVLSHPPVPLSHVKVLRRIRHLQLAGGTGTGHLHLALGEDPQILL